MDKLLLVDGSNLLFQMFFGMPARIVNSYGRAIQGTLGFTGALLKLLRMVNPTHAAVFFDGEQASPRAGLDPAYKANRPDFTAVPEEENPYSQLPDIFAALKALSVPYWETADCETDDLIASYALTLGKSMKLVISSFDSDFFQLITENVSVLRYRGVKSTVCTPQTIQEQLGISPGQYADFKSLTGDRSDNLKGAKGVGKVTAAALLKQFGTLERLLEHPEQIEKPAVRETILQNTDRLRRNYQLIKLGNTVPLPLSLEELRFTDLGMTTTEVLKTIGLR